MISESVKTNIIKVYVGGDINSAKQILRRECNEIKLCVTIEPTTFIYTGGSEEGVVVGLLNYPRFPTTPDELWNKALHLAETLRKELYQDSCLVVGTDKTQWMSYRNYKDV